jgi:hypothetical protein
MPMFGPVPSGGDDTAALNAAIAACVASPQDLMLPPGNFQTSAPLAIGDNSANWAEGVKIRGSSRGSTVITNQGTNQASVITQGSSCWRDTELNDMRIQSGVTDGAAVGLWIPNSEISNFSVNRLRIENATCAIKLEPGNGADGEFSHFDDIRVNNCLRALYVSAGQAYNVSLRHSSLSVRPNGIYFETTNSNGGLGLSLFDVNASAAGVVPGGVTNTTWIFNAGSSSPTFHKGGRVENVTQILRLFYNSATPASVGIEDVEFTTDFRAGSSLNTMPAIIYFEGNAHPPTRVKFSRCRFYATDGDPTHAFPIDAQWAAQAYVTFEDCHWVGPANYTPTCSPLVYQGGPNPMTLLRCTQNGVSL